MPRSLLATAPTADQSDDVHVVDLWSSYGQTRSVEDRDRIVLHYLGLVTYVASRVGAPAAGSFDQTDLVQSGVLGLMEAVTRFQPERGLKFETFAVPRIRGAILDEMRAHDWAPRSVRKKARDVDAATQSCRSRLGRTPTSAEVADELNVSTDDLGSTHALLNRLRVSALEELLPSTHMGERLSFAEVISDPFAELPGDAIEEQTERTALWAALEALGARDREVLVHSYVDGLTLAQIGRLLGVTESRVCQLRAKALRELGKILACRMAD